MAAWCGTRLGEQFLDWSVFLRLVGVHLFSLIHRLSPQLVFDQYWDG